MTASNQGVATDDGVWQPQEALDLAAAHFPVYGKVGAQKILIFKVAAGFRAVQQRCPHQEAVLIKAMLLSGGRRIKCPLHNFIFNLDDGSPVNCPGYRLQVFDVKVEDGRLMVRNPGTTRPEQTEDSQTL